MARRPKLVDDLVMDRAAEIEPAELGADRRMQGRDREGHPYSPDAASVRRGSIRPPGLSIAGTMVLARDAPARAQPQPGRGPLEQDLAAEADKSRRPAASGGADLAGLLEQALLVRQGAQNLAVLADPRPRP